MLKKNWGRVIFISSESAQQIPTEMIHYGMTKTAQVVCRPRLGAIRRGHRRHRKFHSRRPHGFRRGRGFCGKHGQTAGRHQSGNRETILFHRAPSSLLKRFETTEEVAAVAAFIASTQATAINGSAVRAEGGVVQSIF